MEELGRSDSAESKKSTADLGDDICSAIKGKLGYAPPLRAGLILAVDAIRTPAHATPPVADWVRANCASLLGESGFHAIWLVGPLGTMTFKLTR